MSCNPYAAPSYRHVPSVYGRGKGEQQKQPVLHLQQSDPSPIDKIMQKMQSAVAFGSSLGVFAETAGHLGLSSSPSATLRKEALDRHKRCVYKVWAEQPGYGKVGSPVVVKLNPKKNDGWHDAKREAEIMAIAKRDAVQELPIPVPKVLYVCTDKDELEVGTQFIVREFIQGKTYACPGDLPKGDQRTKIICSALEALGRIHSYHWVWNYGNGHMVKMDHLKKEDFWREEVEKWSRNYSQGDAYGGDGYGRDGYGDGSTNKLFQDMKKAPYPKCGLTCLIHGDFDISNMVFNEGQVVSILDWKSMQNGSPLADLGYFTMMFLRLEKFGLGYRTQQLTSSKLILAIGEPGDAETLSEKVSLLVYLKFFNPVHPATDFWAEYMYAKAIACARLLSVFQTAADVQFQGHECGQYIKSNSQQVAKVLTSVGRTFLDSWNDPRSTCLNALY